MFEQQVQTEGNAQLPMKVAYLHDWLACITQVDCIGYSACDCIYIMSVPCQTHANPVRDSCCCFYGLHDYLHISGTTLVAATKTIPNATTRTNRTCSSRPMDRSASRARAQDGENKAYEHSDIIPSVASVELEKQPLDRQLYACGARRPEIWLVACCATADDSVAR